MINILEQKYLFDSDDLISDEVFLASEQTANQSDFQEKIGSQNGKKYSPKKRIIVSVINDLVTDQRVARTCSVLFELNYKVLLVGREQKTSKP